MTSLSLIQKIARLAIKNFRRESANSSGIFGPDFEKIKNLVNIITIADLNIDPSLLEDQRLFQYHVSFYCTFFCFYISLYIYIFKMNLKPQNSNLIFISWANVQRTFNKGDINTITTLYVSVIHPSKK